MRHVSSAGKGWKARGTRAGRFAAALLAAAVVAAQVGCSSEEMDRTWKNFGDYLNLRNSFLNPSEVGRFDKSQPFAQARPVQLPILQQLDVIDEPVDHWANAVDPTPADLQPETKEYVFGVGDTIGVSIFELVTPGVWYERNSQITETGAINIMNIGNVSVVGLTPTQLEAKIAQLGIQKGIFRAAGDGGPGPQISATLLASRQRIFSILGAVGGPGTYNIISNDFRLLDALALARDVQVQPGMDYLFVIRQATYGEKAAAQTVPGPATTAASARNPLDVIEAPGTAPMTGPATDTAPATMPATGPGTLPGPSSKVPAESIKLVRELPDSLKHGLPSAMVVTPSGGPRTVAVANDLETALDATTTGAATTAAAATLPATTTGVATTTAATTTTGTATRPTDTELEAAMSQPDTAQWVFVEGKLVRLPRSTSTVPSGTVAVVPPTTQGGRPTRTVIESPTTDFGVETVQTQRVIRIPIQALREGVSRYNIVVRPGDVINIPGAEPGEFYLMGHVSRPGVYTLTGRKVTLKQAVAAAGNLDGLAVPRRCELIRRVGTDQEVVVQVNLQAIFDGDQPDLFIKPNDILNVGSDAIAPFLAVTRNAYRASYGWGFVYDKNLSDNTNNNTNR